MVQFFAISPDPTFLEFEVYLTNISDFSAVKMFKKTGEVFVQKPNEDVPKVFTFDSVYDWK